MGYISREVTKFPYCGTIDEEKLFFSEKLCNINIKTFMLAWHYTILFLALTSSLSPVQAIGLPVALPTPVTLVRPTKRTSKNFVMANLSNCKESKLFNSKELDQLYQLGINFKHSSIDENQLLDRIAQLRGGSYVNVIAALVIIGVILVLIITDVDIKVDPQYQLLQPYINSTTTNNTNSSMYDLESEDCINMSEAHGYTIMDVLKQMKDK